MVVDSSSPLASDTTPSVSSDPPNRPEPVAETPPSASESTGTQPQPAGEPPIEAQPIAESANTAPESASVAMEKPQVQPAPTTEAVAPSPSQQPEGEAVSQSTQPVSEPATVPPAQENGTPETDQEKPENQEPQAATEPQSNAVPEDPQPQNQETPPSPSPAPSTAPSPSIPSLHFPFYGSSPITFDFGAQPTEEKVKKKYEEWDIVGHNGIDFGLKEDTEVIACDKGIVTQAGDNGDFGISVTIKHSWGTSIYSHLQSLGVLVNDTVKKAQVIGSSGQTGFTTGPHLHFGIQPNNPDANNGYLGYINPAPYLTETSPFPQSPLPAEAPTKGVTFPQPLQAPDLSDDLSEEKLTKETPVVPSEPQSPQFPISPQPPQTPQPEASREEIQQQAVAMFDARLKENSIKGNQAKKAKRNEAIQKIFSFAQERKRITNEQVRDFLHVSQSTATDYLSDLVNRGMLKVEGKGKATVYLF